MVKVITVATKSEYYFPYLKESVKRNGGELVVLGYNQEWTGFNLKYSLMIKYLKTLKNNEIVVFVDGYDVICCRNLNDLSNEFLKLKNQHHCKIIVGVDKMDNVIAQTFIYYFFGGSCKGKFLNSGTYIGFAKDILNIITNIYHLSNSNISDDQIQMKKYCRNHPNEFYIDEKSNLFLTINKPYSEIDDRIQIKNGKLFYQHAEPFFLHGPGGTYLDNILIQLGYNNNNGEIKRKLQNDFYKKYFLYLSPDFYQNIIKKNYNYYVYFFIFLLLLFILFFLYYNKNYILKIYKKFKYKKK